jgi:hypothetical protein
MRALATLLAVSLAGCAQLGVQVDVMNPAFANATALEASLRLEATELLSSGHQRTDFFVDRTYDQYERFRLRCINAVLVRLRASPVPADQQLASRRTTLITTWEGLPVVGRESVEGQRAEVRDSLHRRDDETLAVLQGAGVQALGLDTVETPLPVTIRQALLTRRAAISAAASEVRNFIDAQSSRCQEVIDEARSFSPGAADGTAERAKTQVTQDAAQTKQGVEQVRQASIIGNGVLLNDRLEAFYVTRAGERYWAPRYNQAIGEGWFGSTNIALVMNQTADFSVKGFVFDGRSTAQMVQKLGSQAISIIAAAHGAPIGLARSQGAAGASATANPPAFDTSQLVSATQTAVETAQAQQAAFDASLFRVADSVLANWDGLVGGNTVARDMVAGTYRAYKDSWRTSAAPAQ